MKACNERNEITLEARKQAQSCLGKSVSSTRAFSSSGVSLEQKQKDLSVNKDLAWFVPIQITLGICLFYKVFLKKGYIFSANHCLEKFHRLVLGF